MKKLLVIAIVFSIALLALVPTYADISDRVWLGVFYSGSDDYYGRDLIYAYRAGSTAVLTVKVENEMDRNITVTSIYVTMDWGDTYESDQVSSTDPETLRASEIRAFFLDFTVPNNTVASNLFTHSYTIVAEYFYYPNLSDPTTTSTASYSRSYDDFVVYSQDQADARDLMIVINRLDGQMWQSVRARILANKASNETSGGTSYYRQGDFHKAKTLLGAAVDHLNQAWDAEEAFLTIFEELEIRHIEAEIRSMESMANFLDGLSTMWMLFGLGGVLFGLGYVVKWAVHARRVQRSEETATT